MNTRTIPLNTDPGGSTMTTTKLQYEILAVNEVGYGRSWSIKKAKKNCRRLTGRAPTKIWLVPLETVVTGLGGMSWPQDADFQPEDHPVRLDPLPAARILPANAVTEAIKTAPRKSTIPVMNTMVIGAHPKNKEEVMLVTHNLDSEKSFHAKPIEAQFPKIEQVIPPKNRENAFTVALAPQSLSILAEYASRLNCAFIELTFDAKEPLAVVRFDIPLVDGRIVDGAVVPIRAR